MNVQRLEMIRTLAQTYNAILVSHRLTDAKTNSFEFTFKIDFPITNGFLSNFEHEFKTHKIPMNNYRIENSFITVECIDLMR